MVFIALIALLALLGYLITPDHTPFANQQHIELAIRKPGFKVEMLKVRKNERISGVNIINKMLFGEKNAYSTIPVSSFSFFDDLIIITEYTGEEDFEGPERSLSLADVLFALPYDEPEPKTRDGYLIFRDIHGTAHKEDIESLRQLILEENIITKTYWLGTDRFGRDMLSRLLIGARVSLSVGFISVFISLVIGITLGAIGGYFRGWIDNVVIWLINVVWSIPTLLLVIAITFALGKGFWQVFVAVGLTTWVEVARVSRGQILSIREKEFIEAGRALGFSNFRIIFKHILPNIAAPIIVISAANFASAILIEAGLSFLGIGVQPPIPSWGSMIKENYAYIILDGAYMAILPGLCIMAMVFAFMILGHGLRDAMDVKTA